MGDDGNDDFLFKERLIENVRLYPNLWDASRKDHRNNKLTQSCWKKIAGDLRMHEKNADDCKKIFKSLRDYYNKLRKSGVKFYEGKVWPLYSAMEFVSGSSENPDSLTVVPADEKPVCSSNKMKQEFDHLIEAKDNTDHRVSTSTAYVCLPAVLDKNLHTYSADLPNKSSLKRKCTEVVEDLYVPKKEKESSPNGVSEIDCSEEETFGRAVTAQLKKLHPALKARAMFGIQQVLFEQQQEQYQIVEITATSFSS